METKETKERTVEVKLTFNELRTICEAIFRYQMVGESFYLSDLPSVETWTEDVRKRFMESSESFANLYNYLKEVYNAKRED